MRSVIFFSIWMSFNAAFCVAADFFFRSIPFRLILVLSLGCSVAMATLLSHRHDPTGSSRQNKFGFLVLAGTFIYLMFPTINNGTPVHAGWDGANHLFLSSYLVKHENHRSLVEAEKDLCYSTQSDIWSYPWGFHAFVAGFSKATSIPPIFVIYTLFSLIVSLLFFGLFHHSFDFKRGTPYFFIVPFLFIVFSPSGIYTLVRLNNWSQAAGLLLASAIVFLLHYSKEKIHPDALGVLIGGLLLIYPIYAACLLPGLLVLAALRTRRDFLMFLVALAIGSLISAPLFFPTFHRNLDRINEIGPIVTRAKNSIGHLGLILFCVISLPFIFAKIIKERATNLLVPLGVVAVFFFSLYFINVYWTGKVLFLASVLLIPISSAAIASLWGSSFWRRTAATAVVGLFLTILALSPFQSILDMRPVFNEDDLKFQKEISSRFPQRPIFYITRPSKIPWLEALQLNPKVIVTPGSLYYIRLWLSPKKEKLFLHEFQKINDGNVLLAVENPKIITKEASLTVGSWNLFDAFPLNQ